MRTKPGRGDSRAGQVGNGVRGPGAVRHHLFRPDLPCDAAPTWSTQFGWPSRNRISNSRSSCSRPSYPTLLHTRPLAVHSTPRPSLRAVQKASSKTAPSNRISVLGTDRLPLTQAPK